MNTTKINNITIESEQDFVITQARGIYTLESSYGHIKFKTDLKCDITLKLTGKILEVPAQSIETIEVKGMGVSYTPTLVNPSLLNDESIKWI